jgi:DNA (cytosine-5)-methyltransferase 1
MEKLKVLSLFSGIGAFEKALTNLHIDFELVGFSEIDKYAIKSYCAIHNVDELLNFGDVIKIIKPELPDFDLLVGGSPCQAFSTAGHRKGFEDTRGTLFFQYVETLKYKQPNFFVFENVKGLINHDKGNTLNIIAQSFSEVGYRIDIELLNSKFFNVPQNRERIYIVGIREDLVENEDWFISDRKDVLTNGKRRLKELGVKSFNFTYPKQDLVNLRLRDILEENVNEKYYLSEDKVTKLISQLDEPQILRPERTEYGKAIRKDYESGYINESRHNMITLQPRKDGISNTLTSVQKDNWLIEPIMEQIPIEYDRQEGVGKKLDTAHTLSASDWRGLNRNQKQNAVLEVRATALQNANMQGRRIKENDEPSFTVSATDRHGVTIGNYPKYRIRKLTPLECFRLQAFIDEDYQKCIDNGISNTQLYKQAGNSITVTVLEKILKELLNTYL